MNEETLNLEEAAKLAKLGVEAMRELIEAGEVPACQLNRKHTVLLREDVIDFIRAKARAQADERRKAHRPQPAARGRSRRTVKADLSKYGG